MNTEKYERSFKNQLKILKEDLEAVPTDDANRTDRSQRLYLLLCGIVSLIGAGLVVYARTAAFAWDEGFHLLTAQLIGAGKRPYLDFCFPQTPLNAYWNAGWMRVFGDSIFAIGAVAFVWFALGLILRRPRVEPIAAVQPVLVEA